MAILPLPIATYKEHPLDSFGLTLYNKQRHKFSPPCFTARKISLLTPSTMNHDCAMFYGSLAIS